MRGFLAFATGERAAPKLKGPRVKKGVPRPISPDEAIALAEDVAESAAEPWIGARGHGTKLNGKTVKARTCTDIKMANVATTGPDMFELEDYLKFYSYLKQETGFTLYGGDCYSYGQLAGGWLDGVVEAHMKLHDYVALIPIVENAGGIITDWQGKPLPLEPSFEAVEVIATGDKPLHKRLCDILTAG